MALGFEETLRKQLNDLISSVQQEGVRLMVAWQELESKRAQLEEERAAFEAEKQTMAAANMTYRASRTTGASTSGSRLEASFSSRLAVEEEEDEHGRAELDRCGLPSLVPPVPPVVPALCLRMNTGPSGRVRAYLHGDVSCAVSFISDVGWDWAIGAEVLANDAVWKMCVQQCSSSLVMGVIANSTPSSRGAYRDGTFAGWSYYRDQLFAHGSGQGNGSPGWPGWRDNDQAIFKLNALARRLTVHLKRTGQCYTFSDLPAGKDGQWRLCIAMCDPATVFLSCPTDDEHGLVQ